MSSDRSAVLALPYIQPSQAQKHVTHNEALRVLDVLVQPVVASRSQADPPADPAPGTRHIVPAAGSGVFGGRAGAIAFFDGEGWGFLDPRPGWGAHVLDEDEMALFDGETWRLRSELPQRLAGLGVGTPPDPDNPLAVAGPASLFTHAGADHRLKINKAAAGDTASLLFQSGWGGRAELGLAGGDDFALKVSPDGTGWHIALSAERGTGRVTLPAGLALAEGTAAAPALGFAGDADTGLWRPGPDQIAASTGGTRRALLSGAGLQLDVPLTGVAVTQGNQDRTPGRLAKVGDPGIGRSAQLTGSTSLHELGLNPGNYSYNASSVPGGPEASAWPHALQVVEYSVGATTRRMFISARATSSPATSRAWIGMNSEANPIAWYPLPVGAFLVGAVAQSGGIPTGAVIERGANANGEYVRFADGTQICRRGIVIASGVQTANGQLFMSDSYAWNFPAGFAAIPSVSGMPVSQITLGFCALGSTPTTTTSTSIRVLRPVASSSTVGEAELTAIGRWF